MRNKKQILRRIAQLKTGLPPKKPKMDATQMFIRVSILAAIEQLYWVLDINPPEVIKEPTAPPK